MGQPAYRDIAEAIRADINARRMVEGDRLPTVRELATRFGAPTGTVARALDLLRMEGVIVSRHGRGLYVRTFSRIVRSSPRRLARQHRGAGRAIQDADTGARMRVVNVEVNEVAAPPAVATALNLPGGAAVLARVRRFAVEERVVQTATSYIPLDVVAAAPSIAYTGPGPGGVYARMAEVGLAPQLFVESVICRMPSPAEVSELDLPGGTHVVAVTRHAYTADARCVEVNLMLASPLTSDGTLRT